MDPETTLKFELQCLRCRKWREQAKIDEAGSQHDIHKVEVTLAKV
jgi:hypothetical protein